MGEPPLSLELIALTWMDWSALIEESIAEMTASGAPVTLLEGVDPPVVGGGVVVVEVVPLVTVNLTMLAVPLVPVALKPVNGVPVRVWVPTDGVQMARLPE